MSDQFADSSVKRNPPPLGKRHLHYIHKGWGGGQGTWVVRTAKGVLCGTLRCQLVTIRIRLEGETLLVHPEEGF